MTNRNSFLLAALVAGFLAEPASGQGKFPPDSLVNVKVIPKDTPMTEVIAIMRGFAGQLGVRCTFCHIGEESIPLSAYDFVSDEKRPKQVARVMLQMVNAINGQHLSAVPSRTLPPLTVSCETCHRGYARPIPIERLIDEALLAGGVDSASRAYRNLLARLERRGSFNFTETPLANFARSIARTRFDEAMGVLSLNEETHPASGIPAMTRGDLLLQIRRDTAGAVAAYRAALQKDSTLVPARTQLRALGRMP